MRYAFFFSILFAILLLTVGRHKRYGVNVSRAFILGILLTATGIIGTYIMGYLETGVSNAISYYGAVFFVPMIFFPISKIIHMPYSKLMDYCAPCGCAALVMKFNCLLDGCCGGRVLFTTAGGKDIVFPSQIAEIISGAIIVFVLLKFEQSEKYKGRLYPLYLIIYGSSRFFLNLLRDNSGSTGILPNGNIWSVVAVCAGIIWYVIIIKFAPAKPKKATKKGARKK